MLHDIAIEKVDTTVKHTRIVKALDIDRVVFDGDAIFLGMRERGIRCFTENGVILSRADIEQSVVFSFRADRSRKTAGYSEVYSRSEALNKEIAFFCIGVSAFP